MSFGIESPALDRVVTRLVTGQQRFESIAMQAAVHDFIQKGEEIAKRNVQQDVYNQPSTYEDRRSGDLLRAVKASRFFATGAQVYISRMALKPHYYAKFVEGGFTHRGGTHFEGRHFWKPKTEAELRALAIRLMEEAALWGGRAMT